MARVSFFMHAPKKFNLFAKGVSTSQAIMCDAIMEQHHRNWQKSKIQYLADTSTGERREAFLEAIRVLNQLRRFTRVELGGESPKYRPRHKKISKDN